MELKQFLFRVVSSKLKKERNIELVQGEFEGKTPDGILKSGDTIIGVILCFFNETGDEIEKHLREFIDSGVTVYALVQKGRHMEMTNLLWKASLVNKVKIITWDITISF